MKVVDASALLAFLRNEKGREKAAAALTEGVMSVVNLAEVLQKFRREGKPTEGLVAELEIAGMKWDTPTILDAAVVAELGVMRNISLADRFCIALGARLGAPVLTADRDWANHEMPIEIEFAR